MITIIAGTNSATAKSSLIAMVYSAKLSELGVEHQVAHLRDLPTDFISGDMYYNRAESFSRWQEKYLFAADKFMFVVPEYNGSFPGMLKLMIDASDYQQSWKGKKVALCGVSAGRAGNVRGMDQLTNVFHYLKVDVHPNKLPISQINTLMTDGVLTSEETHELISAQINDLIAF